MRRPVRWRAPAAGFVLGAALCLLPGAGLAATPASSAAAAVLPAILDPAAPFVLTSDLFVLVPQGAAVRVEELASGGNRGAAPVVGLTFPLPPGAVGAALQAGAQPGQFSVDSGGMRLAVTVPPGGSAAYAFTFSVSWAGGQLWLPVAYPTGTLLALVPQGRYRVFGPGFARAGRVPLAGSQALDAFGTVAPTPGALLPATVRAVLWWNRPAAKLALLAAAAVLLAAGLLRLRARRRAARGDREAALLEAVARLDLAHERGELPAPSYLQQRDQLLEELAALHGG